MKVILKEIDILTNNTVNSITCRKVPPCDWNNLIADFIANKLHYNLLSLEINHNDDDEFFVNAFVIEK